jgi:hypothetical protein
MARAKQKSTTDREGGMKVDSDDRPECDWGSAYRNLEIRLCEAVNMVRIVNGLVDDVDRDDQVSLEQFSFAVNHARDLLEDLRRGY